jgi:thymidine kinase
MFSGKSTEILRRVRRHMAIGSTVTIINSAKDTRCAGDVLCTHDHATIQCVKTNDISIAVDIDADVIAIDEGQFFTGLVDAVRTMLARGKHVIVGGLDGDFKQLPFGEIPFLIPLADDIVKLHAMCMTCKDGTRAPFTKRTVSGTDQEMVGASDMYIAVCRNHLL